MVCKIRLCFTSAILQGAAGPLYPGLRRGRAALEVCLLAVFPLAAAFRLSKFHAGRLVSGCTAVFSSSSGLPYSGMFLSGTIGSLCSVQKLCQGCHHLAGFPASKSFRIFFCVIASTSSTSIVPLKTIFRYICMETDVSREMSTCRRFRSESIFFPFSSIR